MVRKRAADRADKAMLDAVDQRTDELILEVRRYTAESLREVKGADERTSFEAWAITKIAGLQLIVEHQNAAINELLRRAGME